VATVLFFLPDSGEGGGLTFGPGKKSHLEGNRRASLSSEGQIATQCPNLGGGEHSGAGKRRLKKKLKLRGKALTSPFRWKPPLQSAGTLT